MRKVRLLSANVGLVALVALDVPLVAAAMHHGHATRLETPVATPAAAVVPASVASQDAGSDRVAPPAVQSERAVLLSFSGASNGWRARAGCERAPHLAATTDGGGSWHALKTPAPHILRLTQTSSGAGWLVGADSSCTPAFFSTADGGQTWTAGSGLGQAWVVIGDRVRLPSGATGKPCGKKGHPQAVTAASVTAALLQCSSDVMATTNGGRSWDPASAFPDGGDAAAVALIPGSAGSGVALVEGAAGCGGLAVLRTSDTGKRWESTACLSGMTTPAAVSLAPDGSGAAFGGQKSARTTDGGKTWS